MSLTTTAARQTTGALSCTTGSAWTWSSYTEAIASAAADTYVVGVYAYETTDTVNRDLEIAVAVGSAGNEDDKLLVKGEQYVTNLGAESVTLPLAYGPISAGSRVAVRARSGGSSVGVVIVLAYVEAPGVTTDNLNTAALTASPLGAAGATVASAGSSWANGSWVELVAALGADAYLAGVSINSGTWTDYELDLGLGTAGNETVLTTLRGGAGFAAGGALSTWRLPHLYRVETGGRLAVRARSATTSANATIAVLYYTGVTLPDNSVSDSISVADLATVDAGDPIEEVFEPGQSFGPLVWVEVVGPDDEVYVSAPVTLADPATYYHGYKAPKLLSVGRIARALSDELGQYESQRFSVSLDDMDRQWRSWLGDLDTRLILNKRVTVRMISETAWRQKLRPRTVALGLIRDYRLE